MAAMSFFVFPIEKAALHNKAAFRGDDRTGDLAVLHIHPFLRRNGRVVDLARSDPDRLAIETAVKPGVQRIRRIHCAGIFFGNHLAGDVGAVAISATVERACHVQELDVGGRRTAVLAAGIGKRGGVRNRGGADTKVRSFCKHLRGRWIRGVERSDFRGSNLAS